MSNPQTKNEGRGMRAEQLLAGLDTAQATAVAAPPSPLVVVAGAGAGKTTVLTRRVAMLVSRLDVAAQHVLAVTHTNKAAAEMADRLVSLDPTLGAVHTSTVHAAAWRVLRRFHRVAGFATEPQLVTSTLALAKEAFRRSGDTPVDSTEVLDLLAEFEWAAANGVPPDRYAVEAAAARRSPPWSLGRVSDALAAFAAMKRERNVVDFGDVLAGATRVLDVDEVAERVHSSWRAVVVDEYQDTDKAQATFLAKVRAARPLWNVVGDPRQTIYSFKGADPALLRSEMADPAATVVHLTASWRCSEEILGWANAVIGPTYGPPLESTMSSQRPSIEYCATTDAEPERVVEQLRRWRSAGVPYEEMAVLFRFNAASARFEVACAEAGIPYQTVGAGGFFARPEVLDVLRPFGARARQFPEDDGLDLLRAVVRSTGFDEHAPPDGQGNARARWESLRSLLEIAQGCTDHAAGPLLAELLSLAASSGAVGVSLATIHAAKGLEWKAVAVTSVTEGSLPSLYATTMAEIDEERRLCYVAMTRAARHLTLFVPQRFKNMPLQPSRFLDALPGVSLRRPAAGRGTTGSGRRSAYGSPSSPARAGRSTETGRRSLSTRSYPVDSTVADRQSMQPASTSAAAANLERNFECHACGSRLTSMPARQSKACAGECLTGAARQRFDALVAWRAEVGASVRDSELFYLAVLGKPGPRWPATLLPPADS